MGVFGFIEEAGGKLLGIGNAGAAQGATATAAARPCADQAAALSKGAGDAVATCPNSMAPEAAALDVKFDAASETVTVSGTAADQATREKVVLCCGNVAHVTRVSDLMTVATPTLESQMRTAVKADDLLKISQRFYDTPNKYRQIFELSKPMLADPDKVYPGQVLRTPVA